MAYSGVKCELVSSLPFEILIEIVPWELSTVYTMRCSLVISPPTALATPTLKELSNALDSVVNWHLLGVKLGLEDHELRAIDHDFHGDGIERCKHEMLSHWLRNAKLPTWKAVADALQLMGEHAVSLKIQAKYCSSSTDTGMYILCSFRIEESTQHHTYLNKRPRRLSHTVCINSWFDFRRNLTLLETHMEVLNAPNDTSLVPRPSFLSLAIQKS